MLDDHVIEWGDVELMSWFHQPGITSLGNSTSSVARCNPSHSLYTLNLSLSFTLTPTLETGAVESSFIFICECKDLLYPALTKEHGAAAGIQDSKSAARYFHWTPLLCYKTLLFPEHLASWVVVLFIRFMLKIEADQQYTT